MLLRSTLSVLMLSLLAACASGGRKASDVPVEDRAGVPVTQTVPGADAAGVGAGNVAGVDLSGKAKAPDLAGPANVPTVVYFDYDSYLIKPEYRNMLVAHADYLRARSGRRILIEGHTDDRGGREYNLALGQRRAEAVRKSLDQLGVAEGQLEAVSLGKEKPAVEGAGDEAQAKNRRAVLIYR